MRQRLTGSGGRRPWALGWPHSDGLEHSPGRGWNGVPAVPASIDVVSGSFVLLQLVRHVLSPTPMSSDYRINKPARVVFPLALAIICGSWIAVAGCKDKASADRSSDSRQAITDFRPNCFSAAECQAACQRKVMGACARLATIHEFGWGVKPDKQRGAAVRARACKDGRAESCLYQAAGLDKGSAEREHLLAQARALSEPACLAGKPRACRVRTLAAKKADWPRWAIRACDAKDPRMCFALTVQLLNQEPPAAIVQWEERVGDQKILTLAASLANPQCRSGWGEACTLANDKPSIRAAIPTLEARCNAQYGMSCGWLGEMFEGLDEPDKAAAARRRACRLGIEDACAQVHDKRFVGMYEVAAHTSNGASCDAPGSPSAAPFSHVRITPSTSGTLEANACGSNEPNSCHKFLWTLPNGLDVLESDGDSLERQRNGNSCTMSKTTLRASLTKDGVRIEHRRYRATCDPDPDAELDWKYAKKSKCQLEVLKLRRVPE